MHVRVRDNSVEKNANIKLEGMEGSADLPPTEKVRLLNINAGSGRHADYATITILHTASIEPLHPHADTLFLSPHTSIWN